MTLTAIERAAWSKAAEMFKPQPEVDVFGLIEYEPTPKQAEFHAATEFSVLFGGSAGGGKSRAVTAHALRECVRYPGIRVGAFRRTYGELKESLLAELSQLGFGQALGARWNGTEYELRFPNGSLIMFRYAENMTDATRRQGGQYQLLIFDEQTLMSPDVVKFIESRLRSGRKDLPVLGVRATANPGGVGHGAVRDRYIDATDYGENVVTDVRGRTVRFIPSKLSDNPHVNPEYAMDLMALDGQQRAAFLDGNWDAFAGAMFPDLSRERHVVDPIELPSSWKRYNGIDWGFTAQWAVLWAAIDEDGRVWIYREIYRKQVGEADQAKQILAAEQDDERVLVRFADDAMWATRGDAKPIADVYADNGVYLTKAGKGPGSRVQGWQRWRTFLADGPACAHHRAQGRETCPKLHMFSTCVDTFKELRDLPHAVTGDPEDADPRAPDHLADAGRYLLLNIESAPDSDMFRPLHWRYWRQEPAGRISCGGKSWSLSETWRFATAYLPQGDDANGDFAVMCAWAYTLDGNLLLLDRRRDRASSSRIGDLLAEMTRAFTLDTTFVAKAHASEAVRIDAQRAGAHMTVLDFGTDRMARALPAARTVSAGKVWLPSDTAWTRELVVECGAFPAYRVTGYVETLAAAVHVAATRWAPPVPTRIADEPGSNISLDHIGRGNVDFMNVPL